MTTCPYPSACGLCFTRRRPRPLTPAHWRRLLGTRIAVYEASPDVSAWRGREQR